MTLMIVERRSDFENFRVWCLQDSKTRDYVLMGSNRAEFFTKEQALKYRDEILK
jgi:hypothetical protein